PQVPGIELPGLRAGSGASPRATHASGLRQARALKPSRLGLRPVTMLIRRMVLGVSALATLVATASAQPSSSASTGSLPPGFADVIREFDQTATASLRNPSDIGYTLGVVTADGLSWTKSYGFADVAKQTPATADTTYGVGCGALTTIMLLQLLRDGTVHLSDPVTTYVPELPAPTPSAAHVTLQQLATHTAG